MKKMETFESENSLLYFFYFQSQTDVVLGWIEKSGRPFLMDTWINGYSPPSLDISQDIYDVTGNTNDGVTTLAFTRKRATNDARVMKNKYFYFM